MRSAGEFFAWLWGPSETQRVRTVQSIRPQGRPSGPLPNPPQTQFQSQPMSETPVAQIPIRKMVVEQRIEDGRIVLRRTTVEEIEIRPQ